jgi:hypothetical protein
MGPPVHARERTFRVLIAAADRFMPSFVVREDDHPVRVDKFFIAKIF